MALILAQDGGTPENPWVAGARSTLGNRYQFGGRLRNGEGIDCYGTMLAGAERATGCGWKSFSVKPTELVATIGKPLPAPNPVASTDPQLDRLQPGDVIMLVDFIENTAEPSIGSLDGKPVWVWHVGVFSGDGRWIVGDHFAGKAIETDLGQYLADHADTYAGVFVVRPNGAKPTTCRRHPPMVR
jgi:cell wall-associated NlpC family hydrolase